MDYSEFLPHIDVEAGKTRIMGNMKLYTKLLGKFKGREMTAAILTAVSDKNYTLAHEHAHALKGTVANLSFLVLADLALAIERRCAAKEDVTELCQQLTAAMDTAYDYIAKLLASQ